MSGVRLRVKRTVKTSTWTTFEVGKKKSQFLGNTRGRGAVCVELQGSSKSDVCRGRRRNISTGRLIDR